MDCNFSQRSLLSTPLSKGDTTTMPSPCSPRQPRLRAGSDCHIMYLNKSIKATTATSSGVSLRSFLSRPNIPNSSCWTRKAGTQALPQHSVTCWLSAKVLKACHTLPMRNHSWVQAAPHWERLRFDSTAGLLPRLMHSGATKATRLSALPTPEVK